MIQPVLVPCKRSCDLFATCPPSDPGMLHIYWGTALLQRVPCERSHPMLRLTAGLLYNLRFPLRHLAKCLPFCEKTIRSLGVAFRDCDTPELMRGLLGGVDEQGLSPDRKQYVRTRYLELRSQRNYRKTILAELKNIWGATPCGEVLRRIFREVDAEMAREGSCAADAGPGPGEAENAVSAGDDGAHALSVASENGVEKGKSDCASAGSASTGSRNGDSVSGEETAGPPPCASDSTPHERRPQENEAAPAAKHEEAAAPWPLPIQRLADSPTWCAHAGLFMLLPWLEEGFGDAPAEIRQLALQILAGAVNHEGSRYTDFDSLKLLGDPVHRTIRSQRTWCKTHACTSVVETIFAGNARLANLHRQLIFYFDPHTEEYTGMLKVLKTWHGGLHGIVKGLHLDFIHTAEGFPCYLRHFDNYDDMRRRFLVGRARFKALFGISEPVTWATDRGLWSIPFLNTVADLGDRFITWEKGYKPAENRWGSEHTASGKFSRWRCRNNRTDRRRYRFAWREQRWDGVPNGRRFIVRARKPSGAMVEVSIVTNNTALAPEKIVWIMFNRWVQENDFSYLRRWFGIGELTERGAESYRDIADRLDDRQVESRAYKEARRRRRVLEKELATALLDKHRHGETHSIEDLRKEADELRAQLPELTAELERLCVGESRDPDLGPLDRLGQKIWAIGAKITGTRTERRRAEQAGEIEERVRTLERTIALIQARIKQIPRTESRLEVLIEEEYVRLRMRAKPLADAVRITCRNVFRRPLDIFRPIFDNHRTDHAVLRALTRAPGFVSATPERIDVALLPALTLEPAEKERLRKFLDICEHRAAAMTAFRHGPTLRFHLLIAPAEIRVFMNARWSSRNPEKNGSPNCATQFSR